MSTPKMSTYIGPGASFRVSYDPQPDITAYELASIIPIFLSGQIMTDEEWGALGAMQRHLKRENSAD